MDRNERITIISVTALVCLCVLGVFGGFAGCEMYTKQLYLSNGYMQQRMPGMCDSIWVKPEVR